VIKTAPILFLYCGLRVSLFRLSSPHTTSSVTPSQTLPFHNKPTLDYYSSGSGSSLME